MSQKLKRRTLLIVGAFIVGAGLTCGGLAIAGAMSQSLPPCEHEDSNGCYWDAEKRGNGQGRSFDVDKFGNVTYWDDR